MPVTLQCQYLEVHSKKHEKEERGHPSKKSFNKVSLENPTAQHFCGVTLYLCCTTFSIGKQNILQLWGTPQPPSNETMLSNSNLASKLLLIKADQMLKVAFP